MRPTPSLLVRLALLLCVLVFLGGCVLTDEGALGTGEGASVDEPLEPLEPGPAQPLELDVVSQVNRARVLHGLAPVARSAALDEVARQHVADLEANYPYAPCSLHSWSTDGPWTACCYSDLEPVPECMWNKPAELTGYTAPGFEIATSIFGQEAMTSQRAVELWLASTGHREVLLNQGTWADDAWQAVGGAVSAHYAVVWFGKEPDATPR